VTFVPEFCSVSSSPQDVGVVEGGLAFFAYGCGAMFSATSLHMYPHAISSESPRAR
jgi:hypothetical protein